MMQYIASPYSHPDPSIREARFLCVRNYTYEMLRRGRHVFSPIVYSHQFAVDFDLAGPFDQWEKFDFDMIDRCDELVVLMLGGWDRSVGVKAEIEYARRKGKNVSYVDYDLERR